MKCLKHCMNLNMLKDGVKNNSWSDEETHQKNENFKDEIVDAFHFFMNIMIAAGMNADELFDRYLKKNKINIERQETGY